MKNDEHSADPADQDKAPADQENPLANIMVNILIPVIALSWLSKDGNKAWHIGPINGMIVAVLLPTAYFIWHFIKTRKVNFYSILGAAGVMLTGSITWYAWTDVDGIKEIKGNAALLFAIKEAAIPLLLGITILYSHRTSKPLVGVFLLNPDILDVPRIEAAANSNDNWETYQKIRWQGTWMLAGSLLLSAVLNFVLAIYLLSGITKPVDFNAAVGKLTWVGFLVIGIPLMVIMMSGLFYLIRKISAVTGLPREEVFLPR